MHSLLVADTPTTAPAMLVQLLLLLLHRSWCTAEKKTGGSYLFTVKCPVTYKLFMNF
jgi:hypothetical protein